MRYPKFLPENGTIGFVAPAFGCADEGRRACFNRARYVLGQMGYHEKLGPNCYLAEGIGISNTPAACAAELTGFYCAGDIDVIISCGGGELMCETMSQVSLERIAMAEPKWYMGSSDNTNMTFLLTTMFDTASVYGTSAKGFGMEPMHQSIIDALSILTGTKLTVSGYEKWQFGSNPLEDGNPTAPYFLNTERKHKIWLPESTLLIEDAGTWDGCINMEGRLLGGCMDCLVNLLGTRFDLVKDFLVKYEDDGILWFLEACDLNVFSIRRAMWQMEEAGWFRTAKGFLIGRPLCYGEQMMGLDAYEAILSTARKHGVPVIMDMDLGHLPPSMPIVCGSVGSVEAKGNRIDITYQFR